MAFTSPRNLYTPARRSPIAPGVLVLSLRRRLQHPIPEPSPMVSRSKCRQSAQRTREVNMALGIQRQVP